MSYEAICPGCGKLLVLNPEDSGRQVQCGGCGTLVQLPVFEVIARSASASPPSAYEPPKNPLPPLPLPGLGLPPGPPSPPRAPEAVLPPPEEPPAYVPPLVTPPRPRYRLALRGPMLWGVVGVVATLGMILGGVLTVLLLSPSRDATPASPAAALQEQRSSPPARVVDGGPAEPLARRDTPVVVEKAIEPNQEVRPVPLSQPQKPSAASVVVPATLPLAEVDLPKNRPPAQRVILEGGTTDEQIEESIRGGVEYLLAHFQNPGWKDRPRNQYDVGVDCLCIQALLQCAQTLPDERLNINGTLMRELMAQLRQFSMGGVEETYARSIRATTLAIHNRADDRAVLRADVSWLLNKCQEGGYTYGDEVVGADNSNSQYGVLGVWSGGEAGLEIPLGYWTQVRKYWTECQHPAGTWGYRPGGLSDGSLSMTAAGLTSLLVAYDYLESPLYGREVARTPFPEPIARALAWLEKEDNCLRIEGGYPGYTAYALERVGLASGFKYFGQHEWYPELAKRLIDRQKPALIKRGGKNISCLHWTGDEQWKNHDLIETAFALLFLARGRHPVLMNKLRFEGCWSNRPRDVANLARFASHELERPLNWQVVPLERDWSDWMDSPILYLASHKALRFQDEDLQKLRRYAEAGGLIFAQADGDRESFNQFIEGLGDRLFPEYEWKTLPLDHPIYTVHYKVQEPPPLRYIGNGMRILLLHSPRDLAQHWQLRAEKTRRSAFELGANLFIHAAGKTELRNRLSSLHLPPLSREPSFRIKLARLRYPGRWDPEPHAFRRFARWLEYETGYRLDFTSVGVEHLTAREWPVAHLTGSEGHTLTDAEVASMRQYVEDGGVLLIDACGGSAAFDQSTQAALRRAFPQEQFASIPADHPLLAGTGNGMEELSRPRLRPRAQRPEAQLRMLKHGKGYVIYSALDLTMGLLGTNTWDIVGYQPAYAQSFLKNALLWVVDGAKSRSD